MKLAALAAVLLVAACTDHVPVHGDLATFDGHWTVSARCVGASVGGRCDLPSWFLGSGFPSVALAVVSWSDFNGAVHATHRGDVLDGCLSVPAGADDGLTRDAYDLCPVDGSVPAEISGTIVWGRGTAGECACDTTLRLQP